MNTASNTPQGQIRDIAQNNGIRIHNDGKQATFQRQKHMRGFEGPFYVWEQVELDELQEELIVRSFKPTSNHGRRTNVRLTEITATDLQDGANYNQVIHTLTAAILKNLMTPNNADDRRRETYSLMTTHLYNMTKKAVILSSLASLTFGVLLTYALMKS